MPFGPSSHSSGLLCYPSAVVVVQPLGIDWRNEPVLLDLIEQRAIADAEQPRGCLAVPVGLFQCVGNGTAFGLAFCISDQRLQRRLLFASGVAVLPVFVSVSITMRIRRGGTGMRI